MTQLVDLFTQVLERSLTLLPVLVVLLLGRALLLRLGSRQVVCALWAVVGLRLVLPVSLPSPLSIFNVQSVQQVQSAAMAAAPALERTDPRVVGTALSGGMVSLPAGSQLIYTTPAACSMLELLAVVWAVGVVVLLGYGAVSYGRLRRRVDTAVRLEGNVFACDTVETPFVLGFFKPRIYLPFRMEETEQNFVLLHERAHIRRRDYLVKPLAFCLLAGYWFHPGVWLAWLGLQRDMEISCDEAVLRTLGGEVKAAYSRSLLDFATPRRFPAPTPLAFGEHDAAARIRHVLDWKRAAPAVTFLVVATCVLVALVCGTDGRDGNGAVGWMQAKHAAEQPGTVGQFELNCPDDTQSFVFYQEVYDQGRRIVSPMVMGDFETGVSQRRMSWHITGENNLVTGQVGYALQSGDGGGYTFPSRGAVWGDNSCAISSAGVYDTAGKQRPLEADDDVILMAWVMSDQNEGTFADCEMLLRGEGLEETVKANERVYLLHLRLSTSDSDTTTQEVESGNAYLPSAN